MSTIHLMCGYIGFGKTTVAKQIEQETGARRFTPDDVMIELFGTDVGDDFMEKANKVDEYIWEQIALTIKNGQDVIYDAGSWSADDRKYVMQRIQNWGQNPCGTRLTVILNWQKNAHWHAVKVQKSYPWTKSFLMKIYPGMSQ